MYILLVIQLKISSKRSSMWLYSSHSVLLRTTKVVFALASNGVGIPDSGTSDIKFRHTCAKCLLLDTKSDFFGCIV